MSKGFKLALEYSAHFYLTNAYFGDYYLSSVNLRAGAGKSKKEFRRLGKANGETQRF